MNTAKLLNMVEKGHYPFKSYPRARCETVLFPGCAFPSQFPRTMDALALLCRELGMGVAYDCCGRSLVGFGEPASAARVLSGVERRLARVGCQRVVTVCPNCLDYLSGRIGMEVSSIFDVFAEEHVESRGTFGPGRLFIPCPDKASRRVERLIRSTYDLSRVDTMEHAACCGLRPQIASRGADVSADFGRRAIAGAEGQTIYTYCASCLGQFGRLGYEDCRHVVSVILGVDERPDVSGALRNRARRRFDRGTDPLTRGGAAW